MSQRSRQRRALRQASVSGRTRIHLRVFMAEADRHIAAELAAARMAGLVTACVRGCHACCYECVAITPAEAVLIVDHVRHTPAAVGLADRARAQLARLAGVRTPTQYRAKREACLFLRDGECSIYDVRPLSCRAYFAAGDARNCHDLARSDSEAPIIVEFPALIGMFLGFIDRLGSLSEATGRAYVTQDPARRRDTSGHEPIRHAFMARHLLDALGEQP